jgi:NitT/TauT family transport system ATP-binding protein
MPAVEARSVSKSFGQQQIIAPLDLTIAQGEFVSLIGSSGCGKSTLLHLCAGLQEPTSGSIKIFGQTPAAACAAHEIGLACQRPALVPSRTALQNVQLTLTIAQPKQALQPAELLRHFGLDQALNLFPHQLSGGMQQRVNIACALVHEPSLLLLDEPYQSFPTNSLFESAIPAKTPEAITKTRSRKLTQFTLLSPGSPVIDTN